MNTLGMIAIVVDEYDLAISHYVNDLGIEFIESPRQETYGQVVVFLDKYGNKWDLIEKK